MKPIAETQQQSEPWYRQFWPWFLIALPGSVVVASFVTLWLAISSPNPMVVDDYARIARSTEKRMERDLAAAALGVRAEVRIVAGAELVEVRLSPESVAPESLELRLSHPLVEELDQVLKLTRVPEGWSARLAPPAGRWYLQLYPGDRAWRLSGELQGEHRLVLLPGGQTGRP
jgi:uncharacterized protein